MERYCILRARYTGKIIDPLVHHHNEKLDEESDSICDGKTTFRIGAKSSPLEGDKLRG